MSISKVAKLAGVSSSTVSRVINNHPRVAPKTAQSVRAAMQNLGYTPSDRRPGPKPSQHARRSAPASAFLVLGTSRTRATPAFQDLLRGVSMGASRHELNLNFHHVADPDHPPLRAIEQGIDGILLHGAAPQGEARERLRHLPTVWLMGNARRPDWGDQVLPDAYQIGELAAKYLMDRGHQRLAFFNLEAGHWSLRVYGHAFASTAQDAGVHVDRLEQASVSSTEYWHDYSVDAVDSLVKKFLALSPRPTGIFVADDMQVAMLQPALQKHGVQLGQDAQGRRVDIISCNNEQPYLVGLQPRPAVVDIRVESIGRRGVEQLLWRLDHPEVTERIITAIEPVVIVPENVSRAMTEAVAS
jgi:DNA-binding LacI/PurR family transcriptional regulator